MAAAVIVGAVLSWSVLPEAGADPVESAADDLVAATADRVQADEAVAAVERQLAEARARLDQLGQAGQELTDELTAARRELREFAVAAYIDGGQSEIFRASLSPEKAQALAWQSSLSLDQSTSAGAAADRFEVLKEANDPEQVEAAEELDRLEVALEAARFDQIQAAAFERDAESALSAAQAARDAAAERAAAAAAASRAAAADAAQSTTTSSDAPAQSPRRNAAPAPSSNPAPPPPPASGAMGNPTAQESATLAKIRQCESRGNYSIVSSTGRYRGAYQFDVTTWRAVGGVGDPAAASPAEQDYRALLLLRMRGTRPWPHCGR